MKAANKTLTAGYRSLTNEARDVYAERDLLRSQVTELEAQNADLERELSGSRALTKSWRAEKSSLRNRNQVRGTGVGPEALAVLAMNDAMSCFRRCGRACNQVQERQAALNECWRLEVKRLSGDSLKIP